MSTFFQQKLSFFFSFLPLLYIVTIFDRFIYDSIHFSVVKLTKKNYTYTMHYGIIFIDNTILRIHSLPFSTLKQEIFV